MAPPNETPAQTHGARIVGYGCLSIVGLGVAAVVIAIALAPYNPQPAQSSPVATAPAQSHQPAISVRQLYTAFEDNEVRANADYKGQQVTVTGTIDSIGTDILGTPFLAFDPGDAIFRVQAMFGKADEPALARLSKGETVVVSCRCDGKLGNVVLSKCVLQ